MYRDTRKGRAKSLPLEMRFRELTDLFNFDYLRLSILRSETIGAYTVPGASRWVIHVLRESTRLSFGRISPIPSAGSWTWHPSNV